MDNGHHTMGTGRNYHHLETFLFVFVTIKQQRNAQIRKVRGKDSRHNNDCYKVYDYTPGMFLS